MRLNLAKDNAHWVAADSEGGLQIAFEGILEEIKAAAEAYSRFQELNACSFRSCQITFYLWDTELNS